MSKTNSNLVQCASCSTSSGELLPLVCDSKLSLGPVCEKCREAALGHYEVLFRSFGGRHASREDDAAEPYYFPQIENVVALREVAFRTVAKNPNLLKFMCEGDRTALVSEALNS
jgi:hypothetical protein